MGPADSTWMLDAIGEPILIVRPTGRVEHLNQAARSVLPGLAAGSLLSSVGSSAATTFLSRCRGAAQQIPGRVSITIDDREATFRCTGARLSPPTEADDRLLIRLLPPRDDRFAHLEQRLNALDEELRARNAMLDRLEAEADARIRAEGERDQVRAALYQDQFAKQKRMARELHDQIGQHAVSLKLGLHRLQGQLTDPRQRALLANLQHQAETIGLDLRRIVNELRPSGLEEFGLDAALRNLVEDIGAAAELDIAFRVVGAPLALSPEAEETLFCVAREALTNVLKHARSVSLVAVTLHYRLATAVVTIEDDGCGFEPDDVLAAALSTRRSFGLRGMRERLTLIGGECELESTPGRGTTVSARVSGVSIKERPRDRCEESDPDRPPG